MIEYTLSEWLSEWYETYKKPKLKPFSAVPIETAIRLHVPETLKKIPLSDLRVLDLDKAVSSLPPSRTQKLLYDTLVSALRKAYRLEFISKDISKLLEPVKYSVKQGITLNAAELISFLERIRGHKLERLFHFYILTGCRRHEALTLTWADVDQKKNILLFRGTKTQSSFRVFPLVPELRELLNSLPRVELRVFPFNDDYITKTFKKFCPSHRLHDLRHTFSTICAENNVHPSVTQRLLGHTRIDTTMRIYTHVANAFIMKEAGKIDFGFLPYQKKDS